MFRPGPTHTNHMPPDSAAPAGAGMTLTTVGRCWVRG